MEAKRIMFALFLGITILNCQASARRLSGDVDLRSKSPRRPEVSRAVVREHIAEDVLPAAGSYQSTEYKKLEEIDRLKLSINKLICDTMDDHMGCDHMDDAADHSDTDEQTNESFATLNPHDHVTEY